MPIVCNACISQCWTLRCLLNQRQAVTRYLQKWHRLPLGCLQQAGYYTLSDGQIKFRKSLWIATLVQILTLVYGQVKSVMSIYANLNLNGKAGSSICRQTCCKDVMYDLFYGHCSICTV